MDGNITPASFTLERIRDPKLRPLMNRITVSENLEFTKAHPEALMSEREVVTKSGERFVERASYPRGHRQNPMTDQEVETKFLGLCQEVLTPQKAQTALDTLWGLEDLPDIGQVIDLFQV